MSLLTAYKWGVLQEITIQIVKMGDDVRIAGLNRKGLISSCGTEGKYQLNVSGLVG